MKTKLALLLAICTLPLGAAAQVATGAGNPLRPEDFKWMAIGRKEFVYQNNGDEEACLISLRLKPRWCVETTLAPKK